MTDLKSLPNDHPLKPLENRMLEMATDMGPLMVAGGNFVAALRVFAAKHPGLVDLSNCSKNCPGWVWNSRIFPNGNQCVRTTHVAPLGKPCPVFNKDACAKDAE